VRALLPSLRISNAFWIFARRMRLSEFRYRQSLAEISSSPSLPLIRPIWLARQVAQMWPPTRPSRARQVRRVLIFVSALCTRCHHSEHWLLCVGQSPQSVGPWSSGRSGARLRSGSPPGTGTCPAIRRCSDDG
jgi:hypothetical protein